MLLIFSIIFNYKENDATTAVTLANAKTSEADWVVWTAKLVVDTGQASVSLLQRRFRIGYARAGRLIDELESLGIITGHSGSKAREVLVDYEYIDNLFNK